MKELSLFTGMGGGIYGSMILGWKTVAYVEKNEYCQAVIAQRIKDGWFDNGEIYGDIAEFNREHAHKYRGFIDIITGGFPCQPHSLAGKRQGANDERYLWDEIEKTIEIVRPKWLFFENVRGVLSDPAVIAICKIIEGLGYELKPPLIIGSADCGNLHRRERVWIYATDAKVKGKLRRSRKVRQENEEIQKRQHAAKFNDPNECLYNSFAQCERRKRIGTKTLHRKRALQRRESIRGIEDLLSRPDIPPPLFCGVDDELPDWREQLKAVGNGQDPIVMAVAYNLLSKDAA